MQIVLYLMHKLASLFNSSKVRTFPSGLLGVLMISALVFELKAASSWASFQTQSSELLNPASIVFTFGLSGTYTHLARMMSFNMML